MADLPMDTQPAPQSPQTNQDPAYNALRDITPEGPAKEAIGEITSRLNDYHQKAALADANQQAGANFVNDIADWKNGMESAVRNDPNFVHTAMDVTVPFIRGVTTGLPDSDTHGDTLIRDMHHDLSTLAVYTAAEQNGDQARALLDNGRIAGNLSEDERGVLGRYISHQDDARARDGAVQRAQAQKAQFAETNDRALGWAGLLNGQIPATFHSSVLADQNIQPETKGHLGDLAAKLMVQGDNRTSDPFLLTDYVKRLADGEKIPTDTLVQGVTRGDLTMSDMLHLSTRGLGASPGEAATLAATLDTAQQHFLGPNNENGIAGAAAYHNFTNWLMGQYRGAGPGSLDARNDNYLFDGADEKILDRFYPKGDDLLTQVPPKTRRPLAQIFADAAGSSYNPSQGQYTLTPPSPSDSTSDAQS